jgi:hypothetical protein
MKQIRQHSTLKATRAADAEFSDASEDALSAMSNEGCPNEYTATLPRADDRKPQADDHWSALTARHKDCPEFNKDWSSDD